MFGSASVFISVVSKSKPHWPHVLTLQGAMNEAARHKIASKVAPRVGESLICRARQNDLVVFMQHKFDYLLSVDDDVEVPRDAIWRLVEDDKDIVGGTYRLKNMNMPQVAIRIPGDPDWDVIFKNHLVTPAIYVSSGCMLIKREVIEKMIKEYPELHYKRNITNDRAWALYMPMVHNMEYLSEDWAFCQRASDVGFAVWVDGGIRCPHWGPARFDFDEG